MTDGSMDIDAMLEGGLEMAKNVSSPIFRRFSTLHVPIFLQDRSQSRQRSPARSNRSRLVQKMEKLLELFYLLTIFVQKISFWVKILNSKLCRVPFRPSRVPIQSDVDWNSPKIAEKLGFVAPGVFLFQALPPTAALTLQSPFRRTSTGEKRRKTPEKPRGHWKKKRWKKRENSKNAQKNVSDPDQKTGKARHAVPEAVAVIDEVIEVIVDDRGAGARIVAPLGDAHRAVSEDEAVAEIVEHREDARGKELRRFGGGKWDGEKWRFLADFLQARQNFWKSTQFLAWKSIFERIYLHFPRKIQILFNF